MNIKELRLSTGMERKEFAEYFKLPYRTLQNWELELREAPEYLVELIKYKIKKEELIMKKQLNILRDGEYITIENFIEKVENADTWDEIEVEDYKQALKDVALDYDNYDDPDKMWNDFLSKVKPGE